MIFLRSLTARFFFKDGDSGVLGIPRFALGILGLGEAFAVSILFEGGEDFARFILMPNESFECFETIDGVYSRGVFGVFGVLGVDASVSGDKPIIISPTFGGVFGVDVSVSDVKPIIISPKRDFLPSTAFSPGPQ